MLVTIEYEVEVALDQREAECHPKTSPFVSGAPTLSTAYNSMGAGPGIGALHLPPAGLFPVFRRMPVITAPKFFTCFYSLD
ncbi:hypothetical protein EBAPG3_15035 [Nitrosospira lacus]|uniref:Uncharacterized protein n=1 Tax=Nitrosospira lacus TaxID=1288494 RepID=A0A1W6SPG6_9PROT|nr:hypothetical protein EBAPG3_15035 [Nitrosospira lacus]